MSGKIYYFSGTGNSLQIAKGIADRLRDYELIPIAKIWQNDEIKTQSNEIGLIFPLHYYGLPKIVLEFINKLNFSKTDYFFSVITYAGGINENPLQQINEVLKKGDKTLNAGFFIRMPSNFIIGYDVHPEERQKTFFDEAKKQIIEISKTVTNLKNNLNNQVFNKDVKSSRKMNLNFHNEVNTSDTSFYADDKCTRCGICQVVCPVNNIVLVDGKPEWQHKCQQCLACINYCPEHAIQFGNDTLTHGRYHHPDVSYLEIKSQKK